MLAANRKVPIHSKMKFRVKRTSSICCGEESRWDGWCDVGDSGTAAEFIGAAEGWQGQDTPSFRYPARLAVYVTTA